MANCSECGKRFGFLEAGSGGKCNLCAFSLDGRQTTDGAAYEIEAKRQQEKRTIKTAIDAITLTTETAPNLNVKSRVGIVMVDADCAFDVAMVKNKNALLSKLKSEANSIGANAVVGITFDMIETYSASIGIGKVNTFKLIAYGTAVVIDDEGV